jgi:hypothetical protein
MKKKIVAALILIVLGIGTWLLMNPLKQDSSLATSLSRSEAESFSRKFDKLTASGKHPSNTVEFRESEINSYLLHDMAEMFPKGLREVSIHPLDNSISANVRINFDEIENAEKNFLISALFRGEHDLEVTTSLKAQNHMGSYDLVGVRLDQKEIPKPLVDLLMQKFVLPKYPLAKPNTPFPLPYNIEKINFVPGRLIVHQASE